MHFGRPVAGGGGRGEVHSMYIYAYTPTSDHISFSSFTPRTLSSIFAVYDRAWMNILQVYGGGGI